MTQTKPRLERQLARLKREQKLVEKQVVQLIGRRIGSDIDEGLGKLEALWVQLKAKREAERVHMKEQLDRIQASAQVLSELAQAEYAKSSAAPQHQRQHDAAVAHEKIRSQYQAVERYIRQYRSEQQPLFNNLLLEETTLSRQLQLLEASFTQWQSKTEEHLATTRRAMQRHKSAPSSVKKLIGASSKDTPKEIEQYNAFLVQYGGYRGGWEEFDHDTFLRLRKQHRDPALYVPAIAAVLLGKTEADVVEHDAWYKRLRELDHAKRTAVAQWRQSEKEKQRAEETKAFVQEREAAQAIKEQELTALKRQRKRQEQQRAKVLKWKKDKERQQSAEAEAERKRDLEKQQQRQQREEARLLSMKDKVKAYAEQRQKVVQATLGLLLLRLNVCVRVCVLISCYQHVKSSSSLSSSHCGGLASFLTVFFLLLLSVAVTAVDLDCFCFCGLQGAARTRYSCDPAG
eukprot:m.106502 g.106502  ORF g.106502 m.106502 type:complete len:459 (-) comp13304_c0_seq1:841-2217(-)